MIFIFMFKLGHFPRLQPYLKHGQGICINYLYWAEQTVSVGLTSNLQIFSSEDGKALFSCVDFRFGCAVSCALVGSPEDFQILEFCFNISIFIKFNSLEKTMDLELSAQR